MEFRSGVLEQDLSYIGISIIHPFFQLKKKLPRICLNSCLFAMTVGFWSELLWIKQTWQILIRCLICSCPVFGARGSMR